MGLTKSQLERVARYMNGQHNPFVNLGGDWLVINAPDDGVVCYQRGDRVLEVAVQGALLCYVVPWERLRQSPVVGAGEDPRFCADRLVRNNSLFPGFSSYSKVVGVDHTFTVPLGGQEERDVFVRGYIVLDASLLQEMYSVAAVIGGQRGVAGELCLGS